MSENKEIILSTKNEVIDNKRNLGLDVLRIMCMIMIIVWHYLGKGGLIGRSNNSQVYYYLYYWIEAICVIAVNCYVLISGYFLLHSKFKWKKVFQIWGETVFYSIAIYFVIIVLGLKEFAIKDMLKSMFPIMTRQYWFVSVYLMLYILSPFINKLIFALTKKEYKTLLTILIIGFSIASFLPSSFTLDNTDGYSIIWFICLYLIAAYIKLYGIPKLIPVKNYLLIYFLCTIFIAVAMVAIDNVTYFMNTISFGRKFLQYNNIVVLIEAIALFIWCSKLKIKNVTVIKLISFIAPLTFAVYLIHEQPQLRSILYRDILHVPICYHNPYSFFIMIESVAVVFLICIFMEYIRKKIVHKCKQLNS